MQNLPLFPLNMVLFPGMPLTLHIFEERYKMMINECIQSQQPFGVLLLKSGIEVLGLGKEAVPYTIGCTAQITQSQPLGAGRLNIVAVGQERFLVHDFDHTQAYLVGQVEMYPLQNPDPKSLLKSVLRLRPWVDRYLTILEKTENVRINPRQLPQNEVALAYLAASLLKIEPSQKQELLSILNALDLSERVRQLYRKEVTLSDRLMAQPELEYQGPFSAN